MKDFEAVKIEFKPEVREKLFWKNGQQLLAHTAIAQMRFSSDEPSLLKRFLSKVFSARLCIRV